MKISSYNITDVGYHYIGLRVLAAMPTASQEEQFAAMSRNVAKYASDKALRLMLPEPRGNFESVGEKISRELAHFAFAQSGYGKGYALTETGRNALDLLNSRKFRDLRRLMVERHITTYDNFRQVVERYIERGPVYSPIVETASMSDKAYIKSLLTPTFGDNADHAADSIFGDLVGKSANKTEDMLRELVLKHVFPTITLSISLFRALTDRLVSLRLLNIMRATIDKCEFAKSYSPCTTSPPPNSWYVPIDTGIFCMSEPDMGSHEAQSKLLSVLDQAFEVLTPQAGYYDLPEVRDYTCEQMMIPEGAFDEGINCLLDQSTAPLTVGLQYERISGRRKPLVRNQESVKIYNLIRRA